MQPTGKLYRLAAFTTHPAGGNPAGVWVGEQLPERENMQRIAAEVGFSETAFIALQPGTDPVARYYSPEAEVPFCGHATIAAGIVLGKLLGDGAYTLSTAVGAVPVMVSSQNGFFEASLTSVQPASRPAPAHLLDEALAALDWSQVEMDPAIPPALAYAGVWHLVLAAASLDRLNRLSYDFDRLKRLMLAENLTTLQLIWREGERTFYARNPFPVGGVVEDPATGAAAAALGGYLRDAGLVDVPATLLIRQGEAMGRPSRLSVHIPREGGITVSGSAVDLPD